jgi:hypothetical protein
MDMRSQLDGQLVYLWVKSIRLFGPKRDELTGEWRKLHNEELSGGWERCAQGSGGET